MTQRAQVVIIGAGFGGLAAAKKLADVDVDIRLIDRRNHHVFQPLLYQVATAGLNPADIAHPIRRAVRTQQNCQVLLCDVQQIDTSAKTVVHDSGTMDYDYLIVAAGATHAYFGNEHWAEFAPGLKSVEDAIEIRRKVLLAFEHAELETDPGRRRQLMNFVVVGAGPTGVEMAGAIAEIATMVLNKDFRSINPADATVTLVEGSDRVLGAFPQTSSVKAQAQLESLGVEVLLNTMVTNIDATSVTLQSVTSPRQGSLSNPQDDSNEHSSVLATSTVIWAAGVAASPLGSQLGAPLDRAGRVVVQPDLSLGDNPEVFVIGDLAAVTHDEKPVPGVAPAAAQAGRHAATMIAADIEGNKRREFRYVDKGSLATIGRSSAVASFGTKRSERTLNLSGFVAWVLWWAVHIMFLVDFRSRIYVMAGWGWQWLTFQRGARLITASPAATPATGTDSAT